MFKREQNAKRQQVEVSLVWKASIGRTPIVERYMDVLERLFK
jgi:hypothetical protein